MGSKEKKRSKKAPQGRKKKGDRGSRKKSAKKLRSYSKSDDDSLISVSSSSNSSEEEIVKGRQSRSRVKKDVKGRKKRARSSSCGSDSSSDSSVRVKKRKSSKRKVGLGRKKKDGKKYKRAVSLSSTNSDESDYEKSRGDSKKKEKRRKYDKEDKNKIRKRRNRARSISPSRESSASDYERKRKRCQSPTPSGSSLSMSSESEREGKRKRYWSPRDSSISRGSKSSDQHVQDATVVQNKPIRKLNSIIVVSATAEPDQVMSKELEHDCDTRDDERSMIPSLVEKGEIIEEKKSATEATALVPCTDDMETILRRKALENLKRFRGPKTSEKSKNMEMSVAGAKQLPVAENAADQEHTDGSNMKHSLSSEIGPTQNESDNDQVDLASSSGKEEVLAIPSVNNNKTSFNKTEDSLETETGGVKSALFSEDNSAVIRKADSLNPRTITDKNYNTRDEGVSRHNLISQPSKLSDVKAQSESVLKSQGPLAACSVKDLKLSPQECINSKPVASRCSTDNSSNTQVNEFNDKSISDINGESNIVKQPTVPDGHSSSIPDSATGDHVCSEHKGGDKEQSQFQEKTMTVMRGGELVQVSYKVYIPKKAPAANRRRLNR